jgi:hypothetical protein
MDANKFRVIEEYGRLKLPIDNFPRFQHELETLHTRKEMWALLHRYKYSWHKKEKKVVTIVRWCKYLGQPLIEEMWFT